MAKPTIFLHVTHLFLSFSGVLHNVTAVAVVEDDIRCLQGLKNSLTDPNGYLNSWNFLNYSTGFICKFVGVNCWNDRENRVLGLTLPSMDLSGQLPDALKYCSSVTTLDLSGNRFSGPIPSEICSWIPFLVSLDLSNNRFSGSIPAELGNCTYLNKLVLNNNKLSGNIPPAISCLRRLKVLSLANNNLSGSIPPFSGLSDFEFRGNRHLCGWRLAKCG
ncbi:inactive LRR receptor-like serine/threonine-protein kinase BIR2 [Lycium barbarum]|uniref:inactive LRR receptor-like serine/threonine-protein kinase BIR2 n=1 Tax=Lycium barbarum TaxID=112863 RepID=UPI00293F6F97|nr:inactive LRR receptor-like serine/threonine-protein kinase BIR2 [Lycium barbarum]